MIAYTGIETISNMAEEAVDETHTIPRAIKAVVAAVFAIYALLPMVALSALPVTKQANGTYKTLLGTSEAQGGYAGDPVLGIVKHLHLGALQSIGEVYVGILAATILFIASNAGIIGASRLVYSMGLHRQVPDRLSRLHPRFSTPWIGILLFGTIACLTIIPGQAEFLGNMYAFGAMLSFTIAHASVIRLRIKEPDRERPYRGPGTMRIKGRELPLFAILGGIGTGLAFVVVTILHLTVAASGVGWLILGMVIYVVYRRRQGLDLTHDLQGAAARAPAAVHRVRLPHRARPDLRRRCQRRGAGRGGEADRRGRRRLRGVRTAGAEPALARRGARRGGSRRALGARERAHQGAAHGDQDPHRADPHAQPRLGARRAGRTGRRRGRLLVDAPRPRGRAEDRSHRHLPAREASLPDHHRDGEPHSQERRPPRERQPRRAAPDAHPLGPWGRVALPQMLLRAERPSRSLGVLVALASVAVTTLLLYPLEHIAPVQTLGVVYLLPVLVVAIFWGLGFGVGTAILSAAAFNFFHLPPLGDFTLRHGRDWIGLAAFIAVAIVVGLVAELARARAQELDERRREAALASELAQLLLGAERLQDALGPAAERLAQALGCASARIRLGDDPAVEGAVQLPLRAGGETIGALELPAGAPAAQRERARERVRPGAVLDPRRGGAPRDAPR